MIFVAAAVPVLDEVACGQMGVPFSAGRGLRELVTRCTLQRVWVAGCGKGTGVRWGWWFMSLRVALRFAW